MQKSPMNLTHLLTSGYQDMCLSPSSNILVCGVTGCGKERKGAEVGCTPSFLSIQPYPPLVEKERGDTLRLMKETDRGHWV